MTISLFRLFISQKVILFTLKDLNYIKSNVLE